MDAVVDYVSGSGDTTLIFNYTVASGHTSSDLDYTSTTALALNSGTINDAVGNVAILTLLNPGASGSLSANKDLIIDTEAPYTGSITDSGAEDLDWTKNMSEIVGVWNGFGDTLSGIKKYEYAIGSSGGGSDIIDWTNNFGDTSTTRTGLILTNGKTYYVSVRAVDYAGNVSAIVSSDGITVDTDAPTISSVLEGVATSENYSLSFDGVDDYAIINNTGVLNNFNSSFSIQLFIKSETIDESFRGILTKALNGSPSVGWQLIETYDNGGTMCFITTNIDENTLYLYGPTKSEYSDGTWHSISIVYDQTTQTMYFYFDGYIYNRIDIPDNYDISYGIPLQTIGNEDVEIELAPGNQTLMVLHF